MSQGFSKHLRIPSSRSTPNNLLIQVLLWPPPCRRRNWSTEVNRWVAHLVRGTVTSSRLCSELYASCLSRKYVNWETSPRGKTQIKPMPLLGLSWGCLVKVSRGSDLSSSIKFLLLSTVPVLRQKKATVPWDRHSGTAVRRPKTNPKWWWCDTGHHWSQLPPTATPRKIIVSLINRKCWSDRLGCFSE